MTEPDIHRAISSVSESINSLKHAGSSLGIGAAGVEAATSRLRGLKEALGSGPEFEDQRAKCDEHIETLQACSAEARDVAERVSKAWNEINSTMVGIY